MSTTTIPDVLDRAAELLERDGWRRNAFGPTFPDEHAPRCAVGAIRAADYDLNGRLTYSNHFARDEVEAALGRNLPGWNDEQRDRRKVTRLLRRVARQLRKRAR